MRKSVEPRCVAQALVLFLLAASCVAAAEMRVERDLQYGEAPNQTLDVYAPAEGESHPVIVWIHGGGWRRGDKAGVEKKPQAFVDRGCVFVSINYRFYPDVSIPAMTGDCAHAIHWVHDHAKKYGGDPAAIVVMGHSAGAHLAALVATDDRYLKAEGLSLANLKGCVPVDVSVYDIPRRITAGDALAATFKATFGPDDQSYRELSPVTHIAAGKQIPPFLILHVASRPDTKAQSNAFAEKLRAFGVSAQVFAAEGKNHGTLSSDLGLADDPPTQAVFKFLDGVVGEKADE